MFLKPNIPMLVWVLVILLLTLTPGHSLPDLDMFAIDGIDLVLHWGVFAILGILMTLGFTKQTRFAVLKDKTGLAVTIICAVFGLAIEILQVFIPGRGLEFFDMLANLVGGFSGYHIFTIANKYKAWI